MIAFRRALPTLLTAPLALSLACPAVARAADLTAPGLALAAAPTTLPATAPAGAMDDRLADAIGRLGDPNPQAREDAARVLWEAGRAAEPALREAAASDDPETAARARALLADFRLGISPDAPPAVVEQIRAYQRGTRPQQQQALVALAGLGTDGKRAMLRLYAAERDAVGRQLILNRLRAVGLQTSVRAAIAEGDADVAELLLEGGLQPRAGGGVNALGGGTVQDYAAYCLLRGTLDQKIADLEARGAANDADPLLVAAYRAKGDAEAARRVAARSRDERVVNNLLYEAHDWRRLAEAMDVVAGRSDTADGRTQRIAFWFLAGDAAKVADAVAGAKQWVADHPADTWYVAKALLLTDRRDEAFALMRKRKLYGPLFELLRAHGAFAEALDLADEPDAKPEDRVALSAESARLLWRLGERDKARAAADRAADLAERVKNAPAPPRDAVNRPPGAGGLVLNEPRPPVAVWAAMARAEWELDRRDRAAGHVLAGLAAAPDAGAFLLDALYKSRGGTADAWRLFFDGKFAAEGAAQRLDRVFIVMDGKAAADDIAAWAAEAATAVARDERVEFRRDQRLTGLTETLLAYGRRGEAEAIVSALPEPAKPAAACQKVADAAADAGEWAKAAEWYGRAARRSPQDAAVVYLHGLSLARAGHADEGRRRIDTAKLLPLADPLARAALSDAMEKRGEADEARAQRDLALRFSDAGPYSGSENALRRWAIDEAKRGHYAAAADAYERSTIPVFRSSTGFFELVGYLTGRARPYVWRALAAAESGDVAAARRDAEAALDILPDDTNLPIELVPALEARGQRAAADAVFTKAWDRHEKSCADHPNAAQSHNGAAWLAAKCGRELDAALAHARRAAELDPKNPAILDTFAEVHFRRGERDAAIERMRQCIAIDPKNPYYQAQMTRFTTGADTRPATRP